MKNGSISIVKSLVFSAMKNRKTNPEIDNSAFDAQLYCSFYRYVPLGSSAESFHLKWLLSVLLLSFP